MSTPLAPGNAYLRSLGLAAPAAPIPEHLQLAWQIHDEWNRLRDYWFESPSKDCKTTYWVSNVNVALHSMIHHNTANRSNLQQLFSDHVLMRARRSVRRSPPNVDKLLPGQVADAIHRLLYL